MENLTFTQKVIKTHTIDPLDGHTVIVLEKVGTAGEQFRFEIEPGQRLPKNGLTLFERLQGKKPDEKYYAYAVNGAPELSVTFGFPVTLSDKLHTIDVQAKLDYHAADPRLLVERRNDDPVRKVREKLTAAVTRQLAWRDWATLSVEFREMEDEVHTAVLPLIRQFAALYGVRIDGLGLDYSLREGDRNHLSTRVELEEKARTTALNDSLEHKRAVVQKTREGELTRLTMEQEDERGDLQEKLDIRDQRRHVRQAAANATANAIIAAATAVQNPSELLQAMQIVQAAGNPMQIAAGPSPRGFIGATNCQTGAAGIISELLATTEQMGLDLPEKKRLQSATLHVIAEAIGETPDPNVLSRYATHVRDVRAAANLQLHHFDYLKKFVDPQILQAELR